MNLTLHREAYSDWPVDLAHATEEANAVWSYAGGRTLSRREFWIFRQPSGRFYVRQKSNFGWMIVTDDATTLREAKASCEEEAR